MDDVKQYLKKYVPACLAADPMLARLAAGGSPECADLFYDNLSRLLNALDDDSPGPWAVVREEGGRWTASVHDLLGEALEEYDPDEDFVCRARIVLDRVYLALEGRFLPFPWAVKVADKLNAPGGKSPDPKQPGDKKPDPKAPAATPAGTRIIFDD